MLDPVAQLRFFEESEIPTTAMIQDADDMHGVIDPIEQGGKQAGGILAIVDHVPEPERMTEPFEEPDDIARFEPAGERLLGL